MDNSLCEILNVFVIFHSIDVMNHWDDSIGHKHSEERF